MKNRLFIISFIIISLSFAEQVSKFKIDGMMCVTGCAWKVKTITDSIDGVNSSEVDFEKGTLIVNHNPSKATTELIISKLSKETTYEVVLAKDKTKKSFLDWFKRTL